MLLLMLAPFAGASTSVAASVAGASAVATSVASTQAGAGTPVPTGEPVTVGVSTAGHATIAFTYVSVSYYWSIQVY